MMSFITRFFLVVVALIPLVGCLSPSTLQPVAHDNATNTKNFVANVNCLLAMYGEVLGPLLDLRYGLIQQQILSTMRSYETTAGTVDTVKFKEAVTKARVLVPQITSIQDDSARRKAHEDFLRNSPIVADVALNRISEADAIGLMNAYFYAAQYVPSALQEMLNVASARFFLTSDARLLHKEIQNAYGAFIVLVKKQGQLSLEHSQAVVQFSQSNTSFASVVSLLTSDSVKETVAELVVARTGDPERKAAAEAALGELSEIAKRKGGAT